jgi:hypothetical protein
MVTAQSDYFKTVKETITGKRPLDEEAFSSVAVLAQRLERLKKNHPMLEDVTFSDHVQELADCEMISAIS